MENIIKRLTANRRLEDMANVSRKDTNLPYDVQIDADGKTVSVSVPENPEILSGGSLAHSDEVMKWIVKYRDVLLKHWNKELTDKEALNLLGE